MGNTSIHILYNCAVIPSGTDLILRNKTNQVINSGKIFHTENKDELNVISLVGPHDQEFMLEVNIPGKKSIILPLPYYHNQENAYYTLQITHPNVDLSSSVCDTYNTPKIPPPNVDSSSPGYDIGEDHLFIIEHEMHGTTMTNKGAMGTALKPIRNNEETGILPTLPSITIATTNEKMDENIK